VSARADDESTLHRFLSATSSAIVARSFDVARVNAALTVAAAVRIMNAERLDPTTNPGLLGAQCDGTIMALTRRGTISFDLAIAFSRLLADCRSGVHPRASYPEARAAAKLASSAVELALGSTVIDESQFPHST
jgi:hypothetical protein